MARYFLGFQAWRKCTKPFYKFVRFRLIREVLVDLIFLQYRTENEKSFLVNPDTDPIAFSPNLTVNFH